MGSSQQPNRTDVDDCTTPRNQAWQHLVGDRHEARDVGINHLPPLIEIGLEGWSRPQCKPGIIDKKIDRSELLGQPGKGRVYCFRVADIKRRAIGPFGAEFGHERLDPIRSPPGDNRLPTITDKQPRGSPAKS